MVQPATVSAVAGCVLQRLTCVGRADRRALGWESIHDSTPNSRPLFRSLLQCRRKSNLEVRPHQQS